MNRYTFSIIGTRTLTVEASNPEEAQQKAWKAASVSRGAFTVEDVDLCSIQTQQLVGDTYYWIGTDGTVGEPCNYEPESTLTNAPALAVPWTTGTMK